MRGMRCWALVGALVAVLASTSLAQDTVPAKGGTPRRGLSSAVRSEDEERERLIKLLKQVEDASGRIEAATEVAERAQKAAENLQKRMKDGEIDQTTYYDAHARIEEALIEHLSSLQRTANSVVSQMKGQVLPGLRASVDGLKARLATMPADDVRRRAWEEVIEGTSKQASLAEQNITRLERNAAGLEKVREDLFKVVDILTLYRHSGIVAMAVFNERAQVLNEMLEKLIDTLKVKP